MSRDVSERLREVVAGKPSGAAWLYDRYAARLFRRLRARYGYPGGLDAEDLLHDSYVFFLQNDYRVLRNFLDRNPPGQRTEQRLERYLWDLACGVAANRRRSAALRTTEALSAAPEPAPEPSAERFLLGRDRLERLDDCLEGKGARVYLYYKLRFRDGLEPVDIARATGWSRKATYKLKQSLNRAVEECAEELQLAS